MARDEYHPGGNHANTPTAIGAGAVTGAAIGAAGAGPIGAAIGAVGGAIVGGLTERAMHAGDVEDEDTDTDTRYTAADRQALVPGEPALDRVPLITPEMAREPIGEDTHRHTWTNGRCDCGATR